MIPDCIKSIDYLNWYKNIKIQLDSEADRHKQQKWMYLNIQFPLLVSSRPYYEDQFK